MRHGSVDNYQHCEDCKGYHLQHGMESNQPNNQGQGHFPFYKIRIICGFLLSESLSHPNSRQSLFIAESLSHPNSQQSLFIVESLSHPNSQQSLFIAES